MLKVILSAAAGVVMALGVTSVSHSQSPAPEDRSGFDQFLRHFEDGIRRFVNGDPKTWKSNASRRDDVTIMGAWGAYEKGWAEVEARYDWAASRFEPSGSAPGFEYLGSGVSDDLAYTIGIETSQARVTGADAVAPMVLRVTHIFRKEDGVWKLVHRHADPLIEKTTPGAVLKK